MKTLVTGGTGFVGSHVVEELLEHGYEVRILTRKKDYSKKNIEVIMGDITDEKSINTWLKGIDIVFHVAALSSEWERKRNFMKVNVEGTQNVVNACMRNGVKRIVYMSTAGIYGFPNVSYPLREEEKIRLHNAYALSKFLGEKIVVGCEEIQSCAVRSPLIIGARDTHVVPVLAEMIKKGKARYIRSKENVFSISHPRDVATCLRLAGEKGGKGTVYNVKSFDCSIEELFEKFAEYLGAEAPHKTTPYYIAYLGAFLLEKIYAATRSKKAPPLTRFKVRLIGTKRIISSEKAKEELGFRAKYAMEETVKESVEWYTTRSNKN